MKRHLLILLIAVVAISDYAYAQTNFQFYGYARGEFAFDSRQVIAAREGNYIDWVAPKNMVGGKDLNATANFNGWALESRWGTNISGPDFFGMKSSATIEAHFFGSTGSSINGLGLRNAFVKLENDKYSILMGQYWHPFFVTNVSPGTYNFNAGSPFQPFNRSPQIRLETKGDVRLTVAALTELDFKSAGGSAAQSGLPALNAQIQFGQDGGFVGGAGANYKFIRPTLGADVVGAYSLVAYAKAGLGNMTWKGYFNYGQNMTETLQIGGLGFKADGTAVNNTTMSLWTELSGDISETMEWGIFAGYSEDLGYGEAISSVVYQFGMPMAPVSTWRIAPRLGWKMGNTKFTTGLDYTSTTHGEVDLATGKMITDESVNSNYGEVGNVRLSVSLIQSF